jgi:tetratricopeptide (TPR) repeat protein
LAQVVGILTPRKIQKQKDDRIEAKEKEASLKKSEHEKTLNPERVTPEDMEERISSLPLEISGETDKEGDESLAEPKKDVTTGTKNGLSREKQEKITELLTHIRTRLARHDDAEARSLIIEWLSLDKNHRELNILLASLYEKEKRYTKSEIVYRDIAKLYPEDTEILGKLASNLITLGKYDIAYEIQKKLVSLDSKESNLFTMIGLSWELRNASETLEYAKLYLKQFPKNPDVLWIKAQALIDLGERKEAVEDLIKLKHLSPYNTELSELIQKLLMEEEMGKNFNQ